MTVELEDEPRGCLPYLTEHEQTLAMLDVTIRDLKADGPIKIHEGRAGVCYQVIKEQNGFAKFTDRCCYKKLDEDTVECYIDIPNKWLQILDLLQATLIAVVFVFGPYAIPEWFYSNFHDSIEYVVELKEPLYKTMCIARAPAANVFARHTLDLRTREDFVICRRILTDLPPGLVIPIKISQFDINVRYKKLLDEQNVPVGLAACIFRALFQCKLRDLDAFQDCCTANYLGCVHKDKPKPWIDVCQIIGRIALVFVLPFPFYIRLVAYYVFEYPEIQLRHDAAELFQLPVYYNFRLLQYLTPTHPVWVAAYLIYICSGVSIAYSGRDRTPTRLQQVLIDSFMELKDMSWQSALSMFIRNLIWPFRKYGVFGCAMAVVAWPILVPLSVVVCFIYCLPVFFLTCRIVMHAFRNHSHEKRSVMHRTVASFEADRFLRQVKRKTQQSRKEFYCSLDLRRYIVNIFFTVASVLTIYSVMLLTAEVCGFIVEVLCFTMMGLIVNASKVLKYGSLILLVVIYSYNTYSNVNRKYLKLNRALFGDIKYRIKGLEDFTMLPAHLQGNRGFKACEASEQADYETTDDLSLDHPYHWDINDLILFIDSDDTPRIPKKLFDDVCEIRVAGSPGPVYRSLLAATGRFFTIILFLVFVFIVVMSFSSVYKISSTNQTLATLAGGFMPFMFTKLLRPSRPSVETGLVAFKSKLEEIIKNICQPWPMYDFIFDIEKKPCSDDEGSEDEEDKGSQKSGKGDKGNNKKKDKEEKKSNNLLETPASYFHGSLQKSKKRPSLIAQLESEFRTKVDNLELEPADGKVVDILILSSEENPEWKMEWSSMESMTDVEADLAPTIHQFTNNNRNNIFHKWREEGKHRTPDLVVTQAEFGMDSNTLMAGALLH